MDKEFFSVCGIHGDTDNTTVQFLSYELTPPDFLYKYFGNLDYAIDVIENHRIHLEAPESYNDLYDSSCQIKEQDAENVFCSWRFGRVIPLLIQGECTRKYLPRFQEYLRQLSTDIDATTIPISRIADFMCREDHSLE